MNNKIREELDALMARANAATDELREVKDRLEQIQSEEQDKFDAMPESLQTSAKGEAMEGAANALSEAMDALDGALDYLSEIEAHCETAKGA